MIVSNFYFNKRLISFSIEIKIMTYKSVPKESCFIISLFESKEEKVPDRGSLFLGGVGVLNNSDDFQIKKIGCVLTIIDEWAYKKYNVQEKISTLKIGSHKWICLLDDEMSDIYPVFKPALEFIRENLQKTNVLVHCQGGISRSASIVIAFLMKQLNLSYEQAKNHVKDRRKIIEPNQTFIKQLKQFQCELKIKKTD